MKKGLTELVFILDRSGSMGGLEGDTIGGYNAMLARQKNEAGEAIVTTVLFDDDYELLHDRIVIQGVAPLTEEQYFVRGMTALHDAIGKTIHKISHAQKQTLPEERAEHTMVVITTDGFENASSEFSGEKVRKLIERQRDEFGWEFIFLGANIDAVATAREIGIREDRAANYVADSEGTSLNFEVVSETISCLRSSSVIAENWKERIEENFESKKK